MDKIVIKRVTPLKGDGKVKAFVEFTVNDILFRDFKWVEGYQGFFLAPPTRAWDDKDGKTNYTKQVVLPDALQAQVESLVEVAYGGESRPEPKRDDGEVGFDDDFDDIPF